MTISLRSKGATFLLIHGFISTILREFNIVSRRAVSYTVARSGDRGGRRRTRNGATPDVVVPNVTGPGLLRKCPMADSFRGFVGQTLRRVASLTIVVGTHSMLPKGRRLST